MQVGSQTERISRYIHPTYHLWYDCSGEAISCYLQSLHLSMFIASSVTRFGEISPLWNFLQSFGFFGADLSFGNISSQTLCHWANVNCCKWPNIDNIIQTFVHTDCIQNVCVPASERGREPKILVPKFSTKFSTLLSSLINMLLRSLPTYLPTYLCEMTKSLRCLSSQPNRITCRLRNIHTGAIIRLHHSLYISLHSNVTLMWL